MGKYLKTGFMRKVEKQVRDGEISYGKMLELIQDEVIKNSKKETLEISLKDWDYSCSDGCCYEWGIHCKLNGELVANIMYADANAAVNSIKAILSVLGYKANVDFEEDE